MIGGERKEVLYLKNSKSGSVKLEGCSQLEPSETISQVVITIKCMSVENYCINGGLSNPQKRKMLSALNFSWNRAPVVDSSVNTCWNVITESGTIFIKTRFPLPSSYNWIPVFIFYL